MNVFVVIPDSNCNPSEPILVTPDDTIDALYDKVSDLVDLPKKSFELHCEGEIIKDTSTVFSTGEVVLLRSLRHWADELLIEKSVEKYFNSITEAIQHDDSDLLTALLLSGVDEEGSSIYDAIENDDRIRSLEIILSHRPNSIHLPSNKQNVIRRPNGERPVFPIHKAVSLNILKTLQRHGADLQAESQERMILLHTIPSLDTSLDSKIEMVMYVVNESNDNINQKGSFGATPLHMVAHSDPQLLKLYLELGAIPVVDKTGLSPLHIAGSRGGKENIEILVGCGICINIQNNHGNTPFHFAVRNNNYVSLSVFKSIPNFNPNISNNAGENAIHLIRTSKMIEELRDRFPSIIWSAVADDGSTVLSRLSHSKMRKLLRPLVNQTSCVLM